MIEISDNESYNETGEDPVLGPGLRRGCGFINDYLQKRAIRAQAYIPPSIRLLPARQTTEWEITLPVWKTAENCWNRSTKENAGSQDESGEMLHLLLNQENTLKIPGGLPEGVEVAHKTGETSEVQHDVGIVYGENTDFILCIMVDNITSAANVYPQYHELTETVYDALNEI